MAIKTMRSDAEIRNQVIQELDWDPRVDNVAVAVTVRRGIVTLTGGTSSFASKLAARAAAHRVLGVLDVADEIEVKSGTAKSDAQLAEAIRNALIWDPMVPDARIKSTVSHGWVTLEGEVERTYQREDAGKAIERLGGVRGVTNLILVKVKPVDPGQIEKAIQTALSRRAEHGSKRVDVSVDGTTVTLTGTVDSWGERYAIEQTAGFSPGVSEVQNKIVVDPYV